MRGEGTFVFVLFGNIVRSLSPSNTLPSPPFASKPEPGENRCIEFKNSLKNGAESSRVVASMLLANLDLAEELPPASNCRFQDDGWSCGLWVLRWIERELRSIFGEPRMPQTSISDTMKRGNEFIIKIKDAPGTAKIKAKAKAKAKKAKAAIEEKKEGEEEEATQDLRALSCDSRRHLQGCLGLQKVHAKQDGRKELQCVNERPLRGRPPTRPQANVFRLRATDSSRSRFCRVTGDLFEPWGSIFQLDARTHSSTSDFDKHSCTSLAAAHVARLAFVCN